MANCLRADVANICFTRRVHFSLWQSLNRSNWFARLAQTLAMAPSLSLFLCFPLSGALKLVQKALVAAIDNPQPQLLQLPRLSSVATTRPSAGLSSLAAPRLEIAYYI